MRTAIMAMAVAVVLVAALAPAAWAAQDTKKEIAKRMEARLKALQAAKDNGSVGETHLGYVEARQADKVKKDKALQKLIAAENSDRSKLYKLVAAEQTTQEAEVTTGQVGKQAAIVKFQKAAGHEYFKAKDGKWRTKKQMLEEAKKNKPAA